MASDKHDAKISSITEIKAKKTMEANRETYGDIIRRARIASNLSQPKLAEILGTTRTFVSNWEVGRTKPDMKLIPDLCDAIGISIAELFGRPNDMHALSSEDRNLIHTFHTLDSRNRRTLQRVASAMQEEQDRDNIIYCFDYFNAIPLSELSASAGTGEFLGDSWNGECIQLRTEGIAGRADVIIPVHGNSMEPTFYNGDLLLVQYTEELNEGEIGILIINNEGFVKEFHHNGVRSHNESEFPFRKFKPDDTIRCIGRVLGKVEPEMYPNRNEQAILTDIANGIIKRP